MVTWKPVILSACLAACLVWFGTWVARQQAYHQERQQLFSCANYLNAVAYGIHDYRMNNEDHLPPNIECLDLKENPYAGILRPLVAPPGEKYIYRCLPHPGDMDVIFWDANAHVVRGGEGCKVRNGDFRNVLYAGGWTKEMREQDFEKLHLK